MRLIAIGGAPATGKSSLMRAFMFALDQGWRRKEFAQGLVRGYFLAGHVFVLGRYGTGLFDGTDKLSMAVAPKVLEFARGLQPKQVLAFEGDRLFNRSVLEGLPSCERLVLTLTVSPAELAQRRAARGLHNQGDQWIRGRETKYANLADLSTPAPCDTAEESAALVARLLDFTS